MERRAEVVSLCKKFKNKHHTSCAKIDKKSKELRRSVKCQRNMERYHACLKYKNCVGC